MVRILKPGLLAALLALYGSSASALGLMEVYQAALKNDPVFRSAYYANQSGQENKALGLSNLLPNVQASYSRGKNNSDIISSYGVTHPKYDSKSAVVQVRQSLINFDGIARYKEGVLQADYASSVYLSEQQQVMLRAVSAYVETLFKQDQLAVAVAERDTYVERMKSNDALFAKGEGTRTDMLETRARLDVAEAAVLEAQDNLAATRTVLAGVIGMDPGELSTLTDEFHRRADDLQSFDAWKRVLLERNPDVKSRALGVDIGQQEINKAKAGHYPRLDFVASYSKSVSDSINTINQDSTTRSIALQLTVPLYSGGSVNAATRQAVANREKARADMDAEIHKQTEELRRNYDQVISGASRIPALMKAVASGKLLVTATEQSIKGGVRTNLDLLDAQRQLSTTQRDLAQARYSYIMADLKLRAAAGVLSEDDVRDVAANFR